MDDERSKKAVEVAILFGEGKATREELDTAHDAAYYAYAAAYAAYAGVGGARDEVLATACTIALNALIELQSPGCQFLYLCDAGA